MPDADSLLEAVKAAADAHAQFSGDAVAMATEHAAAAEANRAVAPTQEGGTPNGQQSAAG